VRAVQPSRFSTCRRKRKDLGNAMSELEERFQRREERPPEGLSGEGFLPRKKKPEE